MTRHGWRARMPLCIRIHTFLVVRHRDYGFVKLPFSNRVPIRIRPNCTLALHFLRLKVQAHLYSCPKLLSAVLLVFDQAVHTNPIENVFERRWLMRFGSKGIIDEAEIYSIAARCVWLLSHLTRLAAKIYLCTFVGC